MQYTIDGELTHDVVNYISALCEGKERDSVFIGIDCHGGDPSAGFALSDVIEGTPAICSVKVYGYLYSAAFYALINLVYKSVYIEAGAVGLLHYPSYETKAAPGGKIAQEDGDKGATIMLDNYKQWLDNWAKSELNQKERRLLRSGADVYFTSNRLKEIFAR